MNKTNKTRFFQRPLRVLWNLGVSLSPQAMAIALKCPYLQAHDSNPALLGHLTVLTWGKTRVIFHQHIDVSMQIVSEYPTYTSLCVARASWHAKHDFLRHNQILEHFWDIARTCWQRRYSHNSLSAHAHFRWSSGDEEFNKVVEWTFWGCFAWSNLMVMNPLMLCSPNTYDCQI